MNKAIEILNPKTILVYSRKIYYDFGDIQVIYYDNEVKKWKENKQEQ